MDFECIETWLELPEFRVTGQVIRPHELELHLERRDTYLVCPRCQGCCARIKEGRERCIRDLPILDRPVTLRLHLGRFKCPECHHRPWETSETFGDRVKWTERLYDQVRQEFLHGCPCQELASRYGLSARTVFRWTFEKSRGGRPRKLGRALARIIHKICECLMNTGFYNFQAATEFFALNPLTAYFTDGHADFEQIHE